MTSPLDENVRWFDLTGDARLGVCASEGCGGQPTKRLEAGGVGANYCSGCAAKIAYLSAASLPDGLEVEKKLQAVIDKFDAEITSALGQGERPDLWDGGVDVRVSLIRSAQSAIAALRAERDEALEDGKALRGLLEYTEDSIAKLQSKWQFQLERADAAEAEVKRLTEENETLRKQLTGTARVALSIDGEAYAMSARIKALEEVLRPFAAEADRWEGFDDTEVLVEDWNGGPASSITVSNLRAARQALSENTL